MMDRTKVTCICGESGGLTVGDIVNIHEDGRIHPDATYATDSSNCHGVAMTNADEDENLTVRLINSGSIAANVDIAAVPFVPGALLEVDDDTGQYKETTTFADAVAIYAGSDILNNIEVARIEVFHFRQTA